MPFRAQVSPVTCAQEILKTCPGGPSVVHAGHALFRAWPALIKNNGLGVRTFGFLYIYIYTHAIDYGHTLYITHPTLLGAEGGGWPGEGGVVPLLDLCVSSWAMPFFSVAFQF